MEPAAGEAEAEGPEAERARPSAWRRWAILGGLVVGAVLVLAALGLGTAIVSDARPEFAYEGPSEAVTPGGTVTVHDPDGQCGPLIVSLHREGRLGLWNQTHSGDIFSGFAADARPWWSLGGEYATPVPCTRAGSTTFDLPHDVEGGVLAACDMDGRCARVRVAR